MSIARAIYVMVIFGNSVFDKVEDDLLGTVYDVTNTSRAKSMLAQAQRQLNAVGGDGTKLRWEISTETGAGGIKQLFSDPVNVQNIPGLDKIEIIIKITMYLK